jgi:hypothetical protein
MYICHCHAIVVIKNFKKKYNLTRHLNKKLSCIKMSPICDLCHKRFKSVQGLTRHMNKKVPCVVSKDESIIYLKAQIKQLQQQLNNIVPVINNTTNNNMVNNGTIINGDVTLNINGFMKDNVSYIKEKELICILHKKYGSLVYLGQILNFNPNHPENHNIKLPDLKRNWIKINKNNSWSTTRAKPKIDDYFQPTYYE